LQQFSATASWSFATHSGSLRDAVDGRSAASTWSARALISSTLTSAMGDPRSAVMSLHGDVEGSGAGGGAFLRGETFFAIDLIGDESV